MDERRAFQRYPFRAPLTFVNLYDKQEGYAHSCDISANGIGIVADKELAVDTPLEINIFIDKQGETIDASGVVAWVRKIRPKQYRIGICLHKIDWIELSYIIQDKNVESPHQPQ